MMRIKKIRFIDEVRDQLNDSIDVGIEFEDGSSYTIIVRTPDDLVEEMLEEGTNFYSTRYSGNCCKTINKENS